MHAVNQPLDALLKAFQTTFQHPFRRYQIPLAELLQAYAAVDLQDPLPAYISAAEFIVCQNHAPP